MSLTTGFLVSTIGRIIAGPIGKLLEAHIKDTELRHTLETELHKQLVEALGKSEALQQSVVLAEVQSDAWLTRSWRPILMLSLLGYLAVVGLLLPLADVLAGQAIPFNPRWSALPQGFWDFLSIGVGGYIGGRSLEKIANQKLQVPAPKKR